MANNIHTTTVPLRWTDYDMYGHVNNAKYLEIAQESRLAFAQDNFFSKGHDLMVFVRRYEVDLRMPIETNTTEVTVTSQVVEFGNTSFTTRQELKDQHGRVAAVIETVQVAIDKETHRPRPLTDEERHIMTHYEDE